MRWRKLGRVFACDGTRGWSRTHASVPTVGAVDGTRARVYYSTRDAGQRSHTGWFELDLAGLRVVTAAPDPVLAPGPVGRFDDDGAMVTWAHPRPGGGRYLYYIGWNRGQTVPFRNALGLAVEEPTGEVRRYADGPILDRSVHDPCFVASACVLEEPGRWQMWYLSCIDWRPTPSGLQHQYHLKHATSGDGIDWRRDGTVCIAFRDAEYAISRPSVLHDGRMYRMWYSYRGDRYRIGYAESVDGRRWERQDHRAGIDVTPGDWDGEMVCYPCVFDAGGSRYMLYNGNGYGHTGIGLAVLDGD